MWKYVLVHVTRCNCFESERQTNSSHLGLSFSSHECFFVKIPSIGRSVKPEMSLLVRRKCIDVETLQVERSVVISTQEETCMVITEHLWTLKRSIQYMTNTSISQNFAKSWQPKSTIKFITFIFKRNYTTVLCLIAHLPVTRPLNLYPPINASKYRSNFVVISLPALTMTHC